MTENRLANTSFRDPSGFVFRRDGKVHRKVQSEYVPQYDLLMSSGLYHDLIDRGVLVRHEEISRDADGGITLLPEQIPFISYPYERCFSEMKDAALCMLDVARRALDFGMVLKDASAYNIQFFHGRPIFIDTLSFEEYQKGSPWIAYRQFCEHFLAPLALMSFGDVRLGRLWRIYPEGIPLDLAVSLLPFRTSFHPSLLLHLRLHARFQRRTVRGHYICADSSTRGKIDARQLISILESLRNAISALQYRPVLQGWSDYYEVTNNYSSESFHDKKVVIESWIDEINPNLVWDIGANTGCFSRCASKKGIVTISFDYDTDCVESNYLSVKTHREDNILPLILDICNPSPGIGWAGKEWSSLVERGPADMLLALALVHHLAIGRNIPLSMIAEYFSNLCKYTIVEFAPKQDSNVQKLLSGRKDIFPEYHERGFEKSFGEYFTIVSRHKVEGSSRILYLLSRTVGG
ncbi:MAG: SAM-dependent methyltransferase [Patescibacteria group bacterium]|nr:SAM-dependent methyltransferase [Patescibacteria group bacterium]